jgi:hypothetical protein
MLINGHIEVQSLFKQYCNISRFNTDNYSRLKMKTGRNDHCPCGSGIKYKHCCLSPASFANDEFKDLLAGQEFDSLEDVQALADQFMQQRNQQPQDDFQGLSSEQVHRMLHFPFETPEFFSFSETFSVEPEAPILTLMKKD